MPVVSLVVTIRKQKRARIRATSVTLCVAMCRSSTGQNDFNVAPWSTATVCKHLCSLSKCAPTSPCLPVFIEGRDYCCKLSQSVLQKKRTTPSKRGCRRFEPLIHVPRKKLSLNTLKSCSYKRCFCVCVCFSMFSPWIAAAAVSRMMWNSCCMWNHFCRKLACHCWPEWLLGV